MPGPDLAHSGLAVVIMGVSGCGKSTVAAMLAEALSCSFIEAEKYHSQANKAKMSKGVPLTDTDRIPWLESLPGTIRERLDRGKDIAVSCSALQQKYREILWEGEASQLDLLQIDEAEGITEVDATMCPDAIVHGTIAEFRQELASTVC